MLPVGLYALQGFHVLWCGLCGNGWYLVLILPKHYQYLAYMPCLITGFSYIVFNHRCCLSMVEHYMYPEWTYPVIYPVNPLVKLSALNSLIMTHYTFLYQRDLDVVENGLYLYLGSFVGLICLHH